MVSRIIEYLFSEEAKAKPEAVKPKEAPKAKDAKPKEVVKKGVKAVIPKPVKDKALKAKKATLKGVHEKRTRKTRTSVHFKRPKTLSLPRTPKYPQKSHASSPR